MLCQANALERVTVTNDLTFWRFVDKLTFALKTVNTSFLLRIMLEV